MKSAAVTKDEAVVSAVSNYSDIFRQIESLEGPAKEAFCKGLSKEEKKAYADYAKEKDMTMVSGVFKCFEPVGGSLVMSCRPWEGHEYKYTFEHGKEYIVPQCVANMLEKGCWWPTHSYIMDQNGIPVPSVGKKNYRFSFNTGRY